MEELLSMEVKMKYTQPAAVANSGTRTYRYTS